MTVSGLTRARTWADASKRGGFRLETRDSAKASAQSVIDTGPTPERSLLQAALDVPVIPQQDAIAAIEAPDRLCPAYVVNIVRGATRGLGCARHTLERRDHITFLTCRRPI